ncbi:MAG TPA: hypothetical protein GX530_02950 [Corynebacteriales bacterium]|nr:hypothetical protein [Mycobacteriales bacterium]
MNIKDLFNAGKKITPLIPIFGGWKMAVMVFGLIQFGAPLALKSLNQLQAKLEAQNTEEAVA